MRLATQEITDPQTIENILSGSVICRLAMVDRGKPYILPFNYGYSNDRIYIHAASEGRKNKVLEVNPNVSFEIEDHVRTIPGDKECNWSALYRSVIGDGRVEILNNINEKRHALEIIMRQHGAQAPFKFPSESMKTMVILSVQIMNLTAKRSGNWDQIMRENELEFETDRLLVREINEDDIGLIHELHSIPEVDEFNTLGIPVSKSETERLVQPLIEARFDYPRYKYEWKVLLRGTDEFIGLAGLTHSRDKYRLGEIYYKLHPGHWGNGYATELSRKLIDICFDNLDLHKVEAGVAIGNERSVRVLEKCGMTREGLRRKILPIRGDWVDNYHYAILETDER